MLGRACACAQHKRAPASRAASHPRPSSGPHSRPDRSCRAERERSSSGMALYMLAVGLPSSPLADDSVHSRGCAAQQSHGTRLRI